MKKPLALAICRVSTAEQLKNNSLTRQQETVLQAADKLGVEIPEDGWWSGNVSSKRGTNVKRKDLNEMLARCKKDKRIKYVIVAEPDRFMRSTDEAPFFEVSFKILDVKVHYASDPQLNEDTLSAKLLKFTKFLAAEGSNEERQRKSIDGNSKALRDGRYPFRPKPGYIKGAKPGIPEVHPIRGLALQEIMIRVVTKKVTPPQGLVEFNKSDFMKDGHSRYKMDKFKKILTDPFYAGILEMDKQVKVRNENGLHEPLITKSQHLELVRIMQNRKKNQGGPRKNGNPEYPLSNHVTCELCVGKSNIPRYVGFPHGNGKNPNLIYHKYRCRTCGRYTTRADLHSMVIEQFQPIGMETRAEFIEALNKVWKQQENEAVQAAFRIRHKITSLEEAITRHVEAVTDPVNISIKDEILGLITKKKQEIVELETELEKLEQGAEEDKDLFLRFAFDFIDNIGSRFLDRDLPREHRIRCKLLLFPAGFYLNEEQKVYTPQISPIYTLASNKKDLPKLEKSSMVRVQGL